MAFILKLFEQNQQKYIWCWYYVYHGKKKNSIEIVTYPIFSILFFFLLKSLKTTSF